MSLRTRLLLSYALVIAICLSCVTGSLLLLLRPVAERALLANLSAAAEAQLVAVEDAAGAGPVPMALARRWAEAANNRTRARVLLLDEHYAVLYDSESRSAPKRSLQGQTLSALWTLESPPGPAPEQNGTFPEPGRPGQQWYFVADPWPAPDGSSVRYAVLAQLASRFPLPVLIRTQFLPEIAIGALIGLAVSILLAVLIARSVAAPLQAVAAGAHAITRGEYGTTVAVAGPGEVRELAEDFNVMSARVRAAQQAQRDFVANVSHELKTPLTSIQGFSQAIVDGAAGDAQGVRHAAGVINDEAVRLRRLADDLLELARLDAGQINVRREAVDLPAVLRGCAERLSLRAREAGITLEVNVPQALPPVAGDGDRLAQVFTNLIDNALHHTPAGGRVTVTAAPAKQSVEVVVADSGKGIPAEELPRIFERFYQVDKSRRRDASSTGAGLGLAIVRELVYLQGGTVTVKSAEGRGTEFRVSLPTGVTG